MIRIDVGNYIHIIKMKSLRDILFKRMNQRAILRMVSVKENMSQILKQRFDDTFETITKNGKIHPFSVDIILQDLIDSGLQPLESLRILEEIDS